MCNHFKEWMLKEHDQDTLQDIARYGCCNGFPGLTYYSETTSLYRTYKQDIWNMLCEDAEEQGLNVMELIATFNGADNVQNTVTFENLLVWYAAEKIAYEAADDSP